jgi:hypothetical protein
MAVKNRNISKVVKQAARFTIMVGSRMRLTQISDISSTKTALSILLSVSQLVFVSPCRWKTQKLLWVDRVWNVMAHAQKPDFVFLWNRRVHLNRQGRRFSRLLAVELCASAVVTLDTPCSEVVWRVLAIHYTRLFPLHFPTCASPCANTFQLDST